MKRTKHSFFYLLGILCFFVSVTSVGAQEPGNSTLADVDIDSLFSEEVIEVPQSTSVPFQDPVTTALSGDLLRIGGSFSGSLGLSLVWNDLWTGGTEFLTPNEFSLTDSLKATLYFDARPKEDFRIYGSAKTTWPEFKVYELFADLSLDDQVFLRIGKSTVKWGVGYFWSPADVISLESINVQDATAQREGPVSLRAHIPLYGTQTNFYLYTILDETDVDFPTTALAGKAEFLLGEYELGTGLYYRYDTAERAMLTLTGPLGDFDIFAEGMISRGSAKTFVTEITLSPLLTISTSDPQDHRNNFYYSASGGFSYANQNDNFSILGQYYYNGEGYAAQDRKARIAEARAAIEALSSIPALANSAQMALTGIIAGSGRHYAAINISKGALGSDDLSASVLALMNISDLSGFVKPSLSLSSGDYVKFSLSPTFVFGGADSEYPILWGGNAVSLSFSATVTGAF